MGKEREGGADKERGRGEGGLMTKERSVGGDEE